LAIEVDKFLAEKVVERKDDMHPLEVSAVFLSRMMVMHRSLGTEEQFKRLAVASLTIQEPSPIIKEDPNAEQTKD
jgi:hypothetical protein